MELNDERRQVLIEAAGQVRHWAYAPYSHYTVGAALLTASGKIYDGVNVENAAYPTGICAERVAIFKAISNGERDFIAMAVVTDNGGDPCGACRQVMAEFSLDMRVLVADKDGTICSEKRVGDLLPGAFLPEHLPRP